MSHLSPVSFLLKQQNQPLKFKLYLQSRSTNALGPATLHSSVISNVANDLGLLFAAACAGLLLDGSWGTPGRLAALLPLRNDLEQLGRLVVLEDTVRHAPADRIEEQGENDWLESSV